MSLVCDQLVKEGIEGDTAELGVYRGNTAIFIAKLAERSDRKAYLFDTFEGFPERDLTGIDSNKRFEFADTSLESVQKLIDSDSAVYCKGYFPATIEGNVPENAAFSLVHIDCDLYEPCKAALQYFYPRLLPGGFLIMHDYSSLYWDGVETPWTNFSATSPKVSFLFPISQARWRFAKRKRAGYSDACQLCKEERVQ